MSICFVDCLFMIFFYFVLRNGGTFNTDYTRSEILWLFLSMPREFRPNRLNGAILMSQLCSLAWPSISEGLSKNQIRQSLQAILKSDDPSTEYEHWTQTSVTLPEPLRYWNIINVDDEGQVTEIWHHLRFTTVLINYSLNNFVLPVHSKQFSIKLQTSGWDIPLFSPNNSELTGSEKRPGLTTGFSGTNDNRRLLSLTIEQQDLPRLSHTNAEVLTYLLQKRNRKYINAAHPSGRQLSEVELLISLKHEGIRILIDAGAFILEMNNKLLVTEWLKHDTEALAAVYFQDDQAWVQYQSGKIVPLIAMPFADNLEKCLVYLDQAHTRGTDLKLPAHA